MKSVFKHPQCMKVRIIYSCLKCGASSPSGKHYEFMAYPNYLSTDNKSDSFLYRQLFSPSGIFKLEMSSDLEMLSATAQLLNHSFVEQQVLWKLGEARDFLEGFSALRIWFTPVAVVCSFWVVELVMWEGVSVHGEVCSYNKSGLCFLFVLNISCNVIFFSGYLCVEGEGCYAVICDALLFVEGL